MGHCCMKIKIPTVKIEISQIKNGDPKRISIDPRKQNERILEARSAHIIDKLKTSSDRQLILSSLERHFILKTLSSETKSQIAEQMRYYIIGPRELIFEQGQRAHSFFIVASGRLEVIVNGSRKEILKSGMGFGELALLEDQLRSASIRTVEKACLWGLDRITFKEALRQINEKELEENRQFVDSVHILAMLTADQKEALAEALITQDWGSGQKVVKEGDVGDLFYIIKEGTVSCSEKGKEIRVLSKGEYFGELALIFDSVRTASITTITETKLLSIGRDNLINVLGDHLETIIYRNSVRMAIDRSKSLCIFSNDQIEKILENIEIITYQPCEVVVEKDTLKNKGLFFILKGTVYNSESCFVNFACIGHDSLESTDSYPENLVSEFETHVAFISKQSLEKCLGGKFEDISNHNEILKLLSEVQLFRGVPPEKIIEMTNMMKVLNFQDQDIIVQESTPGQLFFVIKSGTVEVSRGGTLIRTLSNFDYFGEKSLLFDEMRGATVKAVGEVKCWVLDKDHFLQAIDEDIYQQLIYRVQLQDDSISLEELVPLNTLGKGSFGSVYLTAHRSKRTLYALKTVFRSKVAAFGIYEHLLLERKILLQLDHVMIMKLVKTFKDEKRIYFLTEYVQGKDLFEIMRHTNMIKETDAKFLVTCVILILEYLHERNIVYRDLKPENIMINHDGYPKLIDFGIAKIIKGRTFTTVGTPHYMAPEILMGRGYSFGVDWWSLGIILYELLFGILPFGNEEEDHQTIYERIIEHRLVFPINVDPMSPVRHLIQQLLSKNPSARTGGSVSKLRNHRWFSNYNWSKLLTKQHKSNLKPKVEPMSEVYESTAGLADLIESEEGLQLGERKEISPPTDDWDADF